MKYIPSTYEEILKRQRKVILSTDDNSDYFYYMPIVSHLWNLMGYEPVVTIFGNMKDWMDESSLKGFVLNESKKMGASFVVFDKSEFKSSEYNTSTLAQVSRLCSGCLDVYPESSYFLTGDIDMLPLDKNWFNSQDMEYDVHLFHGNGYEDHSRFPMCYIGMTSKTWNETMRTRRGAFGVSLNAILDYQLRKDKKNKKSQWNCDELYFCRNIKSWKGYETRKQIIPRKPIKNKGYVKGSRGIPKEIPIDRLDRSYWDIEESNRHLIDAHSFKNPMDNVDNILKLLKNYISKKKINTISEYTNKFIDLRKAGSS